MKYDACTPRKKSDGGTYWHKIGAMFPDDKGGFSLLLDSAPFPDADGKCIVKMFPPKDGAPPRRDQSPRGAPDDEIPF